MKFSCKKQFKKAIIKYGLAERKVINFSKNDPVRVRAKCDWKGCPWVCLLSTNSRTDSWQIATFVDEHMCPPRRDNKLVTASRIAAKYEKFIFVHWDVMQTIRCTQLHGQQWIRRQMIVGTGSVICLSKDICVGDGTDWVFISDQQKGLLNAVAKWAPQAEHNNCARHIYANWKKDFKKEYQKRF